MKYSTSSNEFPVKGNSRGIVRRNKANRQRIEFRALDSGGSSSSSLNGHNERRRHRNDSMNDNNDKNSPKSTSSNYLTKTGLKLNAGRNRKKSRIKLGMRTGLLELGTNLLHTLHYQINFAHLIKVAQSQL